MCTNGNIPVGRQKTGVSSERANGTFCSKCSANKQTTGLEAGRRLRGSALRCDAVKWSAVIKQSKLTLTFHCESTGSAMTQHTHFEVQFRILFV